MQKDSNTPSTPKKETPEVAEMLSTVMNHPDMPAALYNHMLDYLTSHRLDVTTPEFIADVLNKEKKESEEGDSKQPSEQPEEGEATAFYPERLKPLSAELINELVGRILEYDEDKEAAALISLVFGIAYEKEDSERDRWAIRVELAAFAFTMECSNAAGEFSKRACKER